MRDPFPDPARRTHALKVIGVGNPYRRDDGVGLEVARRLVACRRAGRLPAGVDIVEGGGEPAGLLAAWEGADAVWLVDAVASSTPAGTVHRMDASTRPLPAETFSASTHTLGLADAVEIARTLGLLPAHVMVYGITGRSFTAGVGLDPRVDAAATTVAEAICADLARYPRPGSG